MAEKMERQTHIRKTSLILNSFDKRVLAETSCKAKRVHVAIVQGYHRINAKQPFEHTILYVDPIYTIEEKGEGKLNKRRILERHDAHYLVIPENAAKHIRYRWQISQKESNLVISFTEKSVDLAIYKSGQRQISVLILIPEGLLCISNNLPEVVYYRTVTDNAPRHEIPYLDVSNFVYRGNSVIVKDFGRSTKPAANANECSSIRNGCDNFTLQNMEMSTGIMIYNEITNITLPPVMLGGSRDEYNSRGPFDDEFQALYRISPSTSYDSCVRTPGHSV